MLVLYKSEKPDPFTKQVEELRYYPEGNILRWISTSEKSQRLNWDESFVDFPALEDFYDMESMAFKGPKKAWHSGEMTETATRLHFMNLLRQCKSCKTSLLKTLRRKHV